LQDPQIQVRLATSPGPNGSEIIDDTYNASTQSMLAGLGLLEDIQPQRKIAVLGDMRELGQVSEDEHRVVGRRAGGLLDILITYGDLARIMAAEARLGAKAAERSIEVHSFSEGEDSKKAIVDLLRSELRTGDVVLLKGSRGLTMESMVSDLRSDIGLGAGEKKNGSRQVEA
jgi:UDP-N-acetylmuramoyl-tripeptide--D-alanyl-D-alanine ligase